MQNGDELVQLVQKFVQRSRVGIFRNERTGSTRLEPKLMFWCVSDRFVTARKSMQNGAKLVQFVQKFVQRSRIGIFRNERTRSTPFDPKLIFWCFSDGIVTARKSLQNWAELGQLVQKFVQQVASEFFATNAPDPPYCTKT